MRLVKSFFQGQESGCISGGCGGPSKTLPPPLFSSQTNVLSLPHQNSPFPVLFPPLSEALPREGRPQIEFLPSAPLPRGEGGKPKQEEASSGLPRQNAVSGLCLSPFVHFLPPPKLWLPFLKTPTAHLFWATQKSNNDLLNVLGDGLAPLASGQYPCSALADTP